MAFQKVSEVKIQREPRMWAALTIGCGVVRPASQRLYPVLVVLSCSSLSENLSSFSSPPLLLPPDYKTAALGSHHRALGG